jgi:hypothetical protein
MASVSKGKSSFWYGYLMAGERSSPVLRDDSLETGNQKTVYLFNLKRGEIIEYALEIVANKLRELKSNESGWIAKLDSGYKTARRSFKVRGGRNRISATDVVSAPPRRITDRHGDSGSGDSDMWLESGET